jgi:UDP-4-amino-4,6-dideoxy-N-acetyl-beta-L-altrosamine transaminase
MNNTAAFIPYGRQNINDADIEAVIRTLKSDWITQGPTIDVFEKAIAAYCGTRYAVAVNSATSALHIACLAAELKPGDILWTSPNTFVASANCALYCGAKVDFVDIDPQTYNLSVTALAQKLHQASMQGTLPKVVIPVHFAGQSCEMQQMHALSQQYGFQLIEDASHAIGAQYQQQPVGNCAFSEMTVFSFHPVKIITTGEGGMVLTNREDLYQSLLRLRSHGITRDDAFMNGPSDGPWYYQQVDLGFNYRLTDIQAALGLSQMSRLDAFVERRRSLAARYDALLERLPIIRPWQSPDTQSSFHLYPIQLKLEEMKPNRRQVFDALRAQQIGVNVHYIPVHTQPYYRKLGFNRGDLPNAERYYARAISLPLYYDLSEADQDRVIDALEAAIAKS